MAWASLDDKDVYDDEFQTQHMPVCHIVHQDEGNRGEPAIEGMEISRGSSTW